MMIIHGENVAAVILIITVVVILWIIRERRP